MRVLDAYLSGIEAGRPADPEKLLADHPALAGQLRAYLKVMHLAGRLAEDRRLAGAVPIDPSTDRSMPVGASLLSTLDFGPGPPPQIHLARAARRPRAAGDAAVGRDARSGRRAALGRYQLQGEIARGGMGAILRGRDVDLGRELAIKVLLESHQGDPDVVRRFVEEAQIGGQLQHPGIVPVYELGTFPDRRPYFAMKLVKGRTLAALLHERTGPAHDLPRFLVDLRAGLPDHGLCPRPGRDPSRPEAVERDGRLLRRGPGDGLGPGQGLAQGASPTRRRRSAVNETVITTVRSGPAGSGSESQAGSVLGTPAYMAPEQARGEVDRIDERADVFGLGAILCEILTGRPPFVGSTRERDPRPGRAGRPGRCPGPARCLRGRCRADRPCRDCLAAEPERAAAERGRGGAAVDGLPGRRAGAAAGRPSCAGRGAGAGRGGPATSAGSSGPDDSAPWRWRHRSW